MHNFYKAMAHTPTAHTPMAHTQTAHIAWVYPILTALRRKIICLLRENIRRNYSVIQIIHHAQCDEPNIIPDTDFL